MALKIYVPTNKIQRLPSLHILANVCYLLSLIIAFLMVARQYLTEVLIFISTIISDVEHFFMCLLAIFMPCLFRSFAHLGRVAVELFDFFVYFRY